MIDLSKDFQEFRTNVVTNEKIQEIIENSRIEAEKLNNERNFLATFSANFSLFLLAEYHEWINEQ